MRCQGRAGGVAPAGELHYLRFRHLAVPAGRLDDVQALAVEKEGVIAKSLVQLRHRRVVIGNGDRPFEAGLLFNLLKCLMDARGREFHAPPPWADRSRARKMRRVACGSPRRTRRELPRRTLAPTRGELPRPKVKRRCGTYRQKALRRAQAIV